MSEGPATTPESDPDPGLEKLGDVRREMAQVYRSMKAGTIGVGLGNGLIAALNCIAGLLQDHRDSLWQRRAAKMWADYQKRTEPEEHADH